MWGISCGMMAPSTRHSLVLSDRVLPFLFNLISHCVIAFLVLSVILFGLGMLVSSFILLDSIRADMLELFWNFVVAPLMSFILVYIINTVYVVHLLAKMNWMLTLLRHLDCDCFYSPNKEADS